MLPRPVAAYGIHVCGRYARIPLYAFTAGCRSTAQARFHATYSGSCAEPPPARFRTTAGGNFSIVGGPSYSAETSLKFGVVGQLLYRTGRGDDRTLQPSDVAISAGVSIIGFYRIALTGNTFFARDKHRLTYDAEITSQPTDFWGLGYDAALYNRMTDYTAKRCVVSVRYVYEMFANTYVGAYADFRHLEAVRLGDYAAQYLGSEGRNFNTAGVGLVLSYDSRDYTTNAYRGIYASVEHVVRPQALSNISSTLWRTTVTLDLYRRLWRDCTLAVDLYGEFHSSSTPWLLRAQVGNDWRMRGYYMGTVQRRQLPLRTGRAAPADMEPSGMRRMGRCRQRVLRERQVRLAQDAAQLRHRSEVGVSQTHQLPRGLGHGAQIQ